MGEAKRKREQATGAPVKAPIKLVPDQYWKLRALLRDVEATQQAAQAQVNAASQKAQAYMTSLGLSTTANYAIDDETTSLIEQ